MSEGAIIVLAALVFGWAVLARPLERLGISAPMLFVAAGLLLGNGHVHRVEVNIGTSTVRVLAEITLALVLFSDASGINPKLLRHDSAWPLRLLAVGLPISMAFGTVVGFVVLPGMTWVLAVLVASVVSATDASLSASVITDSRIAERARRALNVESGLNDGLATPVVLIALAAAATALGVPGAGTGPGHVVSAVIGVFGGVLAGVAFGIIGALALTVAKRRGWTEYGGSQLAVLGLVVLTYTATGALSGNGFVAAFVGGLALRFRLPDDSTELVELPDLVGSALAWVIWFVFGAALVVPALDAADWRVLIYAALSLAVVRMVAVGLAMVRSDADRSTRVLLGWFGPRGLASVVFALLIEETLPPNDPSVRIAVAAIAATVLLSVIAHAVSVNPVLNRLSRS